MAFASFRETRFLRWKFFSAFVSFLIKADDKMNCQNSLKLKKKREKERVQKEREREREREIWRYFEFTKNATMYILRGYVMAQEIIQWPGLLFLSLSHTRKHTHSLTLSLSLAH